MTVPGLPSNWPELLADALACMDDDGFEVVWRQVGKTVRFLAREKRAVLTPSADLPACRDEDPAHAAALAACYPDPPEYQHPDGDDLQ